MKSPNSCVYFLFSILLFFSACKKDTNETPPTPTPLTGKLTGKVILTDEFGNVFISSAGMLVTADSGATTFSATTDVDGAFEISGMSSGLYNLTYSKSGFGTYKRFGYPVDASIGGTTTVSPTDTLGQISSTQVSNLALTIDTTSSRLSIQCDLTPVPTTVLKRAIRIFFAKDSLVSPSNYLYSPDSTWSTTSSPGIISGFALQNLLSNGFVHGDSVYLVVYGESRRTNTYYDPFISRKFFPNLNINSPSNRVLFILP